MTNGGGGPPPLSAIPRHAFYSNGGGANHAVAVVGWDDTCAASKFASALAGPGAFLVRNSWGTGFGADGCFWVSYYDRSFAGQTSVFAGAEPASAGERICQHDPLGWIASYGPAGATDPTTAWFAAAYTAAETGTLTAAGFYATAPNAAYEVRAAGSVEGIRDAAVLATGTLAVPGSHTITLDQPLAVSAGQKLVIAVRVTTPHYEYPVAVERPCPGYADATAAAGQNYVSRDGSSWTDMTSLIPATDACLKGHALASGEPAPDPTPGPAPARHPVRRRRTLRDVSVDARHGWRLRAPARRGAYVVVAVATLDTGEVSKPATATLRVH